MRKGNELPHGESYNRKTQLNLQISLPCHLLPRHRQLSGKPQQILASPLWNRRRPFCLSFSSEPPRYSSRHKGQYGGLFPRFLAWQSPQPIKTGILNFYWLRISVSNVWSLISGEQTFGFSSELAEYYYTDKRVKKSWRFRSVSHDTIIRDSFDVVTLWRYDENCHPSCRLTLSITSL